MGFVHMHGKDEFIVQYAAAICPGLRLPVSHRKISAAPDLCCANVDVQIHRFLGLT